MSDEESEKGSSEREPQIYPPTLDIFIESHKSA